MASRGGGVNVNASYFYISRRKLHRSWAVTHGPSSAFYVDTRSCCAAMSKWRGSLSVCLIPRHSLADSAAAHARPTRGAATPWLRFPLMNCRSLSLSLLFFFSFFFRYYNYNIQLTLYRRIDVGKRSLHFPHLCVCVSSISFYFFLTYNQHLSRWSEWRTPERCCSRCAFAIVFQTVYKEKKKTKQKK